MKLSESAKGWLIVALGLFIILLPVELLGGLILVRGAGCIYARATEFQGMTAQQIGQYERQNELLLASLPVPFGVQPQNFKHVPYANGGDGQGVTVGVSTVSIVNLPVEPDERDLVDNWVRDMEARGWRTSPLATQGVTEADLIWVVKAYKGNAALDMHPSDNQLHLSGDFAAQAEKPPFSDGECF
ncbi:MAG TPA: hypothetical protein VND22_09790 [Actinomycetota bacterium]|nr:hypothetical protein [Actinomycetota bacterium]